LAVVAGTDSPWGVGFLTWAIGPGRLSTPSSTAPGPSCCPSGPGQRRQPDQL